MNSSLRTARGAGSGAGSGQGLQLLHSSLEGYANLLNRRLQKYVSVAEYNLRSCLFDSTARKFIGQFHEGLRCPLLESLQSGAVVCPVDQVAYVLVPSPAPSLLAITELTATYLCEGENQCVVLGWAMQPLYGRSMGMGGVETRLVLYEGSPRVLFTMQHPVASSKSLALVPGCILTSALLPHPTLLKAAHLLPPLVFISYDDTIPGLAPSHLHEAFPKLSRCTSATLEKMSLLLLPSVDDYEQQLLALLADDLEGEGSPDCPQPSVTIEERRLKLSQFNGWCMCGPPLIAYLERVSPSLRPGLQGSLSASHGRRNNLVLKGSLEVSGLIAHPLAELVVQLEYVISWTAAAMTTSSESAKKVRNQGSAVEKPSTRHTSSLTLGWGVWLPSDSSGASEVVQQVTLDLKAGPGFQPLVLPCSAHTICYGETKLRDIGTVAFRFAPVRASSPASDFLPRSSTTSQFEADPSPPTSTVLVDSPDAGERPSTAPDNVTGASNPDLTARGAASPAGRKDALLMLEGGPPLPSPSTRARPARSAEAVSRSVLAFLHSVGFSKLTDEEGTPLPSRDPAHMCSATPPSDPLQCGPHRIAVQLLALALAKDLGCVEPQSLVVSYQLATFSPVHQRCLLERGAGEQPAILRREGEEGRVAGMLHFFPVSSFSLPSSDDRLLLTSCLSSSALCISVSHGESLLVMGVATVPLQCLLVTDRDYFQVTLSSPLLLSHAAMDSSITNIPLDGGEGSLPGTLFLRLARLPLAPPPTDPPRTGPSRTEPPHTEPRRRPTLVLARRLYGSGGRGLAQGEGLNQEDSQTRRRKHARMRLVKEVSLSESLLSVQQPLMLTPSLPTQLDNIEAQREELKHARIALVLEASITTTVALRAQLGRAAYFEHKFTNTRGHPLTVTASWKHPSLKLVTSAAECRYLRQLNSIHTTMDDPPFGEGAELFVHPGETVQIPFKYQSFSVANDNQIDGADGVHAIKVYMHSSEKELLSILNLEVTSVRSKVDRVLHFYQQERSFLRRSFQLAPDLGGGPGSSELFACCSEPHVLCEARVAAGSRSVLVKAAVKPSPTPYPLLLLLYTSCYLEAPVQVWQLVIHPVHRADHSVVMGQASSLKLSLRGNHTNRRVSCYSYSQPPLKVVGPAPFLLSAQSVMEVELLLRSLALESSFTSVSAVDMDARELVGVWLVGVAVQEPTVSRAFQITLPAGTDSTPAQKTITFTNPYPTSQTFFLSTNLPSLLRFSSPTLTMQPQEEAVIGLLFAARPHPLSASLLVFINNEADQSEECFLVKAIYTQT